MNLKSNNYYKDILIIFLVLLVVLLFRRWDAFTNAQFWTEDSIIFFQQYLDHGNATLLMPYNGYLHTIPRIIAGTFGTLGVNYAYVPLCYNLSSFLITFFVSVSLYFGAVAMQLRHKILYATFFLFIPIGAEVYMNVTHIIWITSIYMINYLFVSNYTDADQATDNTRPHVWKYLSYFILFLFSLSGTCSVLLSPIIVLILFLERKRLTMQRIIPLAIVLACGTLQLVLLKFIDVRKPYGYWTIHTFFTRTMVELFTNNISDILFLHLLAPVIKYKFIFAISLLILAALIWFFIRAYKNIENHRKYVIPLAGFIFLASSLAIMGGQIGPTMTGFTVMHNDPVRWATFDGWFTYQRYLFIPYTCIAWVFVLGLDKILRWWHIIGYVLFLSLHTPDLKNNLPDLHWKERLDEHYQGKRDTIPTNPEKLGYRVIFRKK